MRLRTIICNALLSGAFLFSGPGSADSGSTQSKKIHARELVELAEHAIRREVSASALAIGASRIEVTAGELDSRLSFDACSRPLDIEVDGTRLQGRISAKLSCSAPQPWAIYVPANLKIFKPVVLSSRSIQRDSIITTEDLMLADHDILGPGGIPLTRLDQALGQRARRPIGANTALLSSMLAEPVLVRRGDRVTITSSSGGISVRANAVAMENGRDGERIRVKNLSSNRIIEATVTGTGTAVVGHGPV